MTAAEHPTDMAGAAETAAGMAVVGAEAVETAAGMAVVGAEAPGTSAVERLQYTAVAPLVDMMDTLVAAEVA
jgi:hypothetical protein